GSIRMPSTAAYNDLLSKNYVSKNNRYAKYDTLATPEDLSALFDVLSSIKDRKGNSPKITANTIMSNPDFDKIKQSGYSEYYYESFLDTLQAYPNCQDSFKIWEQGITSKLFTPQLHGREHINV